MSKPKYRRVTTETRDLFGRKRYETRWMKEAGPIESIVSFLMWILLVRIMFS